MKATIDREFVTLRRFPGGEARTTRVYWDTLVEVEPDRSGRSLRLHLEDGRAVVAGRLSRACASELLAAAQAVLALRARLAAPAEDLGALVTQIESLVDSVGFSPRLLLRTLLVQAARLGASDLHLERNDHGLTVELRRDGTRYHVATLDEALHPRVMATLKLQAKLPSYRVDVPQEGSASVTVDGEVVDARVSIIPTAAGEAANLRLFDPRERVRDLDALGFSPTVLGGVRRALETRRGLLVVAGPSGSGKTTTAYALLRELASVAGDSTRLATVEDPVESRLNVAKQIPVGPELGYDEAVSYLLRQDVDALLVGEIRDRETARAAVQAALTGHLVLTTLHTADATEALARLLELGVPRARLAESLTGVLAQRLVRLRCGCACGPGCNDHHCPRCLGTGWAGRQAVGEWLEVNAALRTGVRSKRSLGELRAGRDPASQDLAGAARALAEAGATSSEEAARCVR